MQSGQKEGKYGATHAIVCLHVDIIQMELLQSSFQALEGYLALEQLYVFISSINLKYPKR